MGDGNGDAPCTRPVAVSVLVVVQRALPGPVFLVLSRAAQCCPLRFCPSTAHRMSTQLLSPHGSPLHLSSNVSASKLAQRHNAATPQDRKAYAHHTLALPSGTAVLDTFVQAGQKYLSCQAPSRTLRHSACRPATRNSTATARPMAEDTGWLSVTVSCHSRRQGIVLQNGGLPLAPPKRCCVKPGSCELLSLCGRRESPHRRDLTSSAPLGIARGSLRCTRVRTSPYFTTSFHRTHARRVGSLAHPPPAGPSKTHPRTQADKTEPALRRQSTP